MTTATDLDAVIETERLVLRNWREEDAALFAKHCNNDAVMRWLGGVQSFNELLEDVQYFRNCQSENGHTFWVIERREDRAFLGFCGLVVVPDADSTVCGEMEIGWRIRSDEWRNGYAEEAARATLNYAFQTLGAERVVSRAAEGNLASQGLMIKLGMTRQPRLDYVPEGEADRLLVFATEAEVVSVAPKSWSGGD